jgi:ankyrin repeat protein
MPLPDRPSLEYLKKLAKERLQDLRRIERSARLAQAQLAVAREHGFASWRALRAELDRRLAAAEPDHVVELFAAIRSGDGTVVDRLLAAHHSLANARNEEGNTPLSAAVDARRAGLIPLLLRRGGDPHLVYAHSAHTPLYWAVVIEAYDCAHALMAAGVEPDLFCAGWARWTACAPPSPPRAGSGRGPRSPGARATRRTARGCRVRPRTSGRSSPTRSTWPAAPVTRAPCASC